MKSIINYIVTPFPQLTRLGYYISLFGVVPIMLGLGCTYLKTKDV